MCAGLLFIQANIELALPDYMSRIVNVGIQQGGIDSPIPDAMRASMFEKLLFELSENIRLIVQPSYIKVNSNSENILKYENTYPVLKQEPIYILQDKSIKNNKIVSIEISKALLTIQRINVTENDLNIIPKETTLSNPMLIVQNGIIAVKNEYASMGMDTTSIRS